MSCFFSVDPLNYRHLSEVTRLASLCFTPSWNEKEFAYFFSHENRVCLGVVEKSGTLLAYFIGLLVYGDLDVISVASHPTYRRQGHGERLMAAVEKIPEVKRIFLEVEVSNASAIALYDKLGFEKIGTRKNYYRGVKDALVMRKVVR